MDIIGMLYSTVGFVVMAGYFPQIIRLWKTKTDCRDISLPAWAMWNYTSFVSLLYSAFELGDLKFSLVNAANLVCVSTIIALTIYKRRRYSAYNPL